MAQADTASIPQACSVQHAAEAIVALINSSPRSPRQEEIEAIIAKVVPSGATSITPLLTKIRDTGARLDEAFNVQGKLTPGHPAEEAAQARIDQLEGDLEDLEGQISSPPKSFADLLAWAEIARAGADLRDDGTMGECQERDVFLRPAARLIEAVLQFAKVASGKQDALVDDGPLLGHDGKPIEFVYANEEFADEFCPWIRAAFLVITSEEEGLREIVRGFAKDPDDPEAQHLFAMLDAWEVIENKFAAISDFASLAFARTVKTLEALEEDDPSITSALKPSADSWLAARGHA